MVAGLVAVAVLLRGRSFTDRCVNLDYNDDLKDFHNGTALLTTGELISAKGITCADLHAPDGNFSYDQIQHIIEDTGLQFGVVRAYIDEYGIQLCGVAFSDVPEPTLDRVRAGTPSVDARRKAGAMKLFGVHVVTTGGLPVEVDEDEDGRMLRMVASAAEGLDMGPDVTELLPEFVLAKSAELTPDQIADAVHAHPTLSETLMEAAHGIEGLPIHI